MSTLRAVLLAGITLALAPAGGAVGQAPKAPAAVDQYGDPLPGGARARLGTVRFRLPEYMQTAALAPDGKLLAVSNYQTIALLDTRTGREVRRLSTNYLGATALAFSPDGKLIASVDNSNRIQLREVATGRLVVQLQTAGAQKPLPPGGNPRLASVTFSADGKFVSAGTQFFNRQQGEVHVWEVPSGKALRRVETLQNNTVRSALSADGKLLATWGQYSSPGAGNNPEPGKTIQLWEVATGKELRRVRIDQPGYVMVSAAVLSPDGKYLAATASGGATLYLWDAMTGKELRRLAGRRGMGNYLVFSPDGKAIAAASQQAAVQMWEVASGKRLGTCEGPQCACLGVAFVSGGRVLAWGLDGQSVALWEVPSGKSLAPEVAHQARVTALAFTASGKQVTSVGADGKVFVWDAATGKALRQVEIHNDDLRRLGYYYGPAGAGRYQSMALSPDGKYVCGGNNSGNTIRLWETASGKPICDFEGTQQFGNVPAGVFSPDSALVAVGSADGTLRIWDVASGELRREVKSAQKNPQRNQLTAAFAPDGKTLALAGTYYEPTGQATDVQVLDVKTGKEVWHLKRAGSFLNTVAFSTDGRFLAAGGNLSGGVGVASGPAIELLDAATGKQAHRLEGQAGQISALAFGPDGRTLAAGTTDFVPGGSRPSVVLWELASGQVRARFTGHMGGISCLAFAPDGRTLASGGTDTSVLLWDLAGDAPRPAGPARLGEQELTALWADLAAADAQRAWQAVRKLRAAPAQALPLLSKHLRPVKGSPATAEQLALLVADLNAKRFPVREKAQKALLDMGPPAIRPLREALKAPGSEEQRARIAKILDKLEKLRLSPEDLRDARAVEALEHMATAEARALLARLAGGSPGARLTREAQAALQRLGEGGS
jgi:WD40 repeat protein